MTDIPPLEKLGRRICIIGPSNSGKSTLADRLAAALAVPVFHLDQLAHHPGSAWQRRDDADFLHDHDQAVQSEAWVMDGNYSIGMPQRFDRATAIIWLDPHPLGFLLRYLGRCLKSDPVRPGALDQATHEFSFQLIIYTFRQYPKNRAKYRKLLAGRTQPLLYISAMKSLNRHYQAWGLRR